MSDERQRSRPDDATTRVGPGALRGEARATNKRGHEITTPGDDFHERTASAVADPVLQRALHNLDRRLRTASDSAAAHPDWKDRAAAIRRETLLDLDAWLDRLEHSLVARGVHVHRASTPADARRVVVELAQARGARTVVKSKSMATEEIDLGNALEDAGLTSVETDLGEYIVQLAGERPSHMITPAIHKTLPQIRDVLAREAGTDLAVDREALTAWARDRLRGEFLRADIGITGVNFAAADTGTLVLVTNEGNGRFCTTLPRVHVAVMPVEKVIPRLADVGILLPLLTTHATGQALSNYVTMISGPRRAGEVDGPEELHVVFLDNRRRTLLGTQYEEMLACIRCGACLNVCPVYRNVSGHAYDSVYSGPMGKVLTPLLSGGTEGTDLPYGSTLCHACSDACPVKIPLGDMILALRADVPDAHTGARRRRRIFWTVWARAWSTPRGYRLTTALGRVSRGRVPGLRAWTSTRELPRPARESFRARWAKEHA